MENRLAVGMVFVLLAANTAAGDQEHSRTGLLIEVKVQLRLPEELLEARKAARRRQADRFIRQRKKRKGERRALKHLARMRGPTGFEMVIREKTLSLPHCGDATIKPDAVTVYGEASDSISAIVVVQYRGISLSMGGCNRLVHVFKGQSEVEVVGALNTANVLYRLSPRLRNYLRAGLKLQTKQHKHNTIVSAVYSVHERDSKKTYQIEEQHELRARITNIVIDTTARGCM